MVIGALGIPGDTHPDISDRDAAAVVRLLRQLNPKAPDFPRHRVEMQLARINQNGGVAVIRENGGEIVAMGTWKVVPTLMRVEALARDVVADQAHPEWQRSLEELLQYLINRAKSAGAERIDLTWNETRPGHEILRGLGFRAPDTNLLRLILLRAE